MRTNIASTLTTWLKLMQVGCSAASICPIDSCIFKPADALQLCMHLQDHLILTTDVGNERVCPLCTKIFASQNDVKNHMTCEHIEIKDMVLQFKCTFCCSLFYSIDLLMRHFFLCPNSSDHHTTIRPSSKDVLHCNPSIKKCTAITTTLIETSSSSTYSQPHNTYLDEDLSDTKLVSHGQIDETNIEYGCDDIGSLYSYTCTKCLCIFSSRLHLNFHLMMHDPLSPYPLAVWQQFYHLTHQNDQDISNLKKKLIICSVCGYILPHAKKYGIHEAHMHRYAIMYYAINQGDNN